MRHTTAGNRMLAQKALLKWLLLERDDPARNGS